MCLKIVVVLGISAWGAFGKQVSIVDTSAVDRGECLLASGSRLSRALSRSSSTLGVSARAWRVEHQALRKAANESAGALDAFIQAQNNSNDACSSRLLESKRALDGLAKDLKAIEEQVESHEELLATETENLNITHNAIDAAESIYESEVKECTDEREAAKKDLAMYSAELEELKQIANPSVRFEHSVKVTLPEKPENFNVAENGTALLDQGIISLANCQAFKAFSQHSKILQVERAKNLTCDEQRDQLQEVFTETYLAVVNLIKDAKARGEDNECFEVAEAKRTSSLVPLTAQREQASARIEYSTQALAALTPVLNVLELRVDKLQKHIEETLTPECKAAAKVSETLQAIRELIISLEKCPGRNDFKLKIPVEEEEEDASALQKISITTATGDRSALQNLGSNKTEVQKYNRTPQHTDEVKVDANALVSQQMTTKPHHHHHRDKHDHNHAHSDQKEMKASVVDITKSSEKEDKSNDESSDKQDESNDDDNDESV